MRNLEKSKAATTTSVHEYFYLKSRIDTNQLANQLVLAPSPPFHLKCIWTDPIPPN